MRDPRKVLTEDGFRKLQAYLVAMEEGLFFIINHADDLHIPDNILHHLYAVQRIVEHRTLEHGDGKGEDRDVNKGDECPHGARLDKLGLGFGCQACYPHAD